VDRPKILIAEDDQILLSMYQRKFMMEGFDVYQAINGSEAMKILENIVPDMIMLDIIMPIMDGKQVLQHVKENEKLKDIPVVMLTNVATLEVITETAKSGVVRYLAKSNNTPNDVVKIVKSILAEKDKKFFLY